MKITVEFASDAGQKIVAVFDGDAGTVSADNGQKGSYSRPEGSKTLEIKGDQDLTLTFADDIKFEPGFTTRYTGPTGGGVAKIVSVA